MRIKNCFLIVAVLFFLPASAMQCYICKNEVETDQWESLECDHVYHTDCIYEWSLTGGPCPRGECKHLISDSKKQELARIAQGNHQRIQSSSSNEPAASPQAQSAHAARIPIIKKINFAHPSLMWATVITAFICYCARDTISQYLYGPQEKDTFYENTLV